MRKRSPQKGFALVIAVIIATLVVSIGVALATLATKEFNLSGTIRDSSAAYYAASTGADCAKRIILSTSAFDGKTNPDTFKCNDQNVSVTKNEAGDIYTYSFQLKRDSSDQNPYDVNVEVKRNNDGTFTVTSKGYNIVEDGAKRLEREVVITVVKNPFCRMPADIVVAVDLSGSISEASADAVIAALTKLVNNLNIAEDKVRLGVITFEDTANVLIPLNDPRSGSKTEILDAIQSITLTPNATNIEDAFKEANLQFNNGGDRADDTLYPDLFLLVTDGIPTKSNREGYQQHYDKDYVERLMGYVETDAAALRGTGVDIFAIGIMDNFVDPGGDDYVPPPNTQGNRRGRSDFLKSIISEPSYYFDSAYAASSGLKTLEAAADEISKDCGGEPPGGGGGPDPDDYPAPFQCDLKKGKDLIVTFSNVQMPSPVTIGDTRFTLLSGGTLNRTFLIPWREDIQNWRPYDTGIRYKWENNYNYYDGSFSDSVNMQRTVVLTISPDEDPPECVPEVGCNPDPMAASVDFRVQFATGDDPQFMSVLRDNPETFEESVPNGDGTDIWYFSGLSTIATTQFFLADVVWPKPVNKCGPYSNSYKVPGGVGYGGTVTISQ